MRSEIVCGDCIDIMSTMEPKSIDMVLCDPPYGVTAPNWDKVIDFNLLWDRYERVCKKDAVIAIFSSQPFTSRLIISNEKNFRYCWYWRKNQGTNFFHAKRMPIRKMEEICIFGGRRYNPQITDGHVPTNSAIGVSVGDAYHGVNTRKEKGGKTTRYPSNILEFSCVDNYSRVHSSQKPVDLLEYLIKTYTDDGNVVLDNCCGSGSTGVASVRLGRNFIGIDSDAEYCEIAKGRIEQACRLI